MNFLKICLGISCVLASAALFVFSLNNAFADSKDTLYYSPTESGKIMMTSFRLPIYESGVLKKEDVNVIVWDTETGKSKNYFVGKSNDTWAANPSRIQLPENPIE